MSLMILAEAGSSRTASIFTSHLREPQECAQSRGFHGPPGSPYCRKRSRKQGEALQAWLCQSSLRRKNKMPVYLGYKCRRQIWSRCSPHCQYQIIADTGAVLLWNYAGQCSFFVPDMYAGQLNNLVTSVQ